RLLRLPRHGEEEERRPALPLAPDQQDQPRQPERRQQPSGPSHPRPPCPSTGSTAAKGSGSKAAKGQGKAWKRRAGSPARPVPKRRVYSASALSVIAWVQAMPSGALVIAGFSGETAASSEATVAS